MGLPLGHLVRELVDPEEGRGERNASRLRDLLRRGVVARRDQLVLRTAVVLARERESHAVLSIEEADELVAEAVDIALRLAVLVLNDLLYVTARESRLREVLDEVADLREV